MNVEVINVGTELLLGEIINTEAPVLFPELQAETGNKKIS